MIVDVASSNLAILITREDINFLLYKNGYNIVIYNSIIVILSIVFSVFFSWIINKKVEIKKLDFKNINSKLFVIILLTNFIIIFSSGDLCKK